MIVPQASSPGLRRLTTVPCPCTQVAPTLGSGPCTGLEGEQRPTPTFLEFVSLT